MTNEQHNRYIGYAFLGNFAFQMFWAIISVVFMYFFMMAGRGGNSPEVPIGVFWFFLAFAVVFQMLFNLPGVVAAYAVLKKKPWARVASIIGGALSIMNVPVGTLAGVYAIWFFAGNEWKEVYEPHNYRPQAQIPPGPDRYRTDEFAGSRSEEDPVPRPGSWR